jgi:Ca2+-binding RTX toxin-like protein
MSVYSIYGRGKDLFGAFQGSGSGETFRQNLLYSDAVSFGIRNADGSESYFTGSGLVWNQSTGEFVSGTVTGITHYRNGAFIDQLSDLSFSAAFVQGLFEDGSPKAGLLSGDDVINASNRILSGIDDRLNGFGGNDQIYGGSGRDTITGGSGTDSLFGESGNDRLHGGSGKDFLNGGDGNDRLTDRSGAADFFTGGSGNDTIVSGAGNDTIYGDEGEDVIIGGLGNDWIYGGADPDVIVYDVRWSELQITFNGRESYFLVESAFGVDRIYSALRIATTDGTHVFDVPSGRWFYESALSGDDWLT